MYAITPADIDHTCFSENFSMDSDFVTILQRRSTPIKHLKFSLCLYACMSLCWMRRLGQSHYPIFGVDERHVGILYFKDRAYVPPDCRLVSNKDTRPKKRRRSSDHDDEKRAR